MLKQPLNALADLTFIFSLLKKNGGRGKEILFFASHTLYLRISSGWRQAGEHGLSCLYRGSRLTWRKAHRWYQGVGTPHGALGVAVGIGGWKRPCSFWKSVVTFQPSRLLGSFLPKHLPAPIRSLSCKSDCCTLALRAEPFQVLSSSSACRCADAHPHKKAVWCSYPVLSLVLVQHVQPVSISWSS